MTGQRRIALATGVTLNVALAGDPAAPPVILLHGFPESHRTWRALAPLLEDELRLIMPDQRGFGASDRPQEVEAYKTDALLADLFALADALEVDRFGVVGHDWGGAIAWAAAIRGDPRIERLAIVNSPHPVVFQKSLVEDADQRAGSQYITAFRNPGFEAAVAAMGFETFFDKSFGGHVDLAAIPPEERAHYIADWSRPGALTAMLNWYRASAMVVPAPGVTVPVPDWVLGAFPAIRVPTLVVWGMRDKALLPVQLDGLDALIDNLAIVRLPGAGHFAPWEAPAEVAAALGPFLAGKPASKARA
ncbi:alpha/beta hydrolase [Sphingomonas sp.]|uniref:alpha/beta fold hydrolase n=1 Tax=Sphingomonas sp. TaxID=28214 RepID=UPI00286E1ADE|nr:alpha/beta hydrolase [Sphingomonas sp.]